jgi:hypothetical protein
MVLANLYLNAPVYLQNADESPSQIIGEDPMNRVIEFTEPIINNYSLEPVYQDLFLADNNTASGIVFAIPHDGENTQHFGGTQFLTHAAVGGNMEPGNYGIDTGYNGLRTTSAGVNLFNNPADNRRTFFTDGQSLSVDNLLDFQDGYAVPKYQNVTSTGGVGSNLTFPDTDYPMFRLAEAYLMYAEATVRGAPDGNITTAVSLVNDLRERAGLSRDVSASDLQDLEEGGQPFLLQERGRELFWEARRRTDLIRFGLYTGSEYTWPWKGNEQAGAAMPSPGADRALYPLPESELQVNPNLEQNPGY